MSLLYSDVSLSSVFFVGMFFIYSILRMFCFLSQRTWFWVYLKRMSPLSSDWKSHGDMRTTSPRLTQ